MNKIAMSKSLPLIRPQNGEFDEQQAVCHGAAHSIHKMGEVIGMIMYHHVLVLEDLYYAQNDDPK